MSEYGGMVLRDCPEPEVEWTDITEEFRALTGKLRPDHMVHEAVFDLQEVMAAAEIGDPKMDSGLGYADRKALSELCDEGWVLREPSDEQTLSIMEHLLRGEVAWWDGKFLPQTMFLCVYMHDRELIAGVPPLHAYVTALLRSIAAVADTVVAGDVREEEEFSPAIFSLECYVDQAATDVAGRLAAATEQVAARAASDGGPVLDAILALMRFRVQFLTAVHHLDRNAEGREPAELALRQCKEQLDALAAAHAAAVRGETTPLEGAFTDDARYWVTTNTLLKTVDLHPWDETLARLHSLIDEHLALCAIWDCQGLHSIMRFVSEFVERKPCPGVISRSRLMLMMTDGQRVLGRDTMSTFIFQCLENDHGMPLYARLMADPATPCNTRALLAQQAGQPVPDTSPEGVALGYATNQAHLAGVIEQLAQVVLTYLFALCHNRARLRRRLANLFPEWEIVQGMLWDCERVCFDGHLVDGGGTLSAEVVQKLLPLSAFAYQLQLDSMLLFLRLGFELDLYSPSEFRPMMWYMEYIHILRFDNVGHLYKQRELGKEETAQLHQSMKKHGIRPQRTRGTIPLPPNIATRKVVEIPQGLSALLEAEMVAARGIVRFLAAGQNYGLLNDPGRPELRSKYCSEQSRYEHRVGPFREMQKPPVVAWRQMQQLSLGQPPTPEGMLGEAVRWLDNGQRLAETALQILPGTSTPEQAHRSTSLEALRKAFKANRVSVMLFARMASEAAKAEASAPASEAFQGSRFSLDWSYCRDLPVVKVVKEPKKPPAEGAAPR
eukprot:TRINITY_DN50208_c0_g1_i1.p1 TRINITY_DN50208_c0_g1~~TRINITY_DN50208_c0_g1_i1.p1  ORF type:complete len:806 (+),score=271.56 TRINITY_DN50208_c0_g1_i1:80-2419(+)